MPASIMAIAAAGLFTRNIYKAYFNPCVSEVEEGQMARLAQLIVKEGALAFVIFLPSTYSIQLQLLDGVWIIQTLPAVGLGLCTRWFHPWGLLVGWAVGMGVGTWMAATNAFASSTVVLGGIAGYATLWALLANFAVVVALSLVFCAARRTVRL